MKIRGCVGILAFVVALGACTDDGPVLRHQHLSHAARVGPALGGKNCKPPSPIDTLTGLPEVEGTGRGATLYGLIMSRSLPVRAGEEVKIVWRMTGAGPLRLSVLDPHGARTAPVWGPDLHAGSNFDRPGDEWGAGYRFATAGCWQLHAQRAQGSADAWIRVRPR